MQNIGKVGETAKFIIYYKGDGYLSYITKHRFGSQNDRIVGHFWVSDELMSDGVDNIITFFVPMMNESLELFLSKNGKKIFTLSEPIDFE